MNMQNMLPALNKRQATTSKVPDNTMNMVLYISVARGLLLIVSKDSAKVTNMVSHHPEGPDLSGISEKATRTMRSREVNAKDTHGEVQEWPPIFRIGRTAGMPWKRIGARKVQRSVFRLLDRGRLYRLTWPI